MRKDRGKHLFCGSTNIQMGPQEVKLDGLGIIKTKIDAFKAIDLIVEQGEGSRLTAGSHFQKFQTIEKEFHELENANPNFCPARPVACSPRMRNKIVHAQSVLVEAPFSARVLDFSNATYGLMLRFLQQLYSMDHRPRQTRQTLAGAAFGLMTVLGRSASLLSKLPAHSGNDAINAGLSFELNRFDAPFELISEKRLLLERLFELIATVRDIANEPTSTPTFDATFSDIARRLEKIAVHVETI